MNKFKIGDRVTVYTAKYDGARGVVTCTSGYTVGVVLDLPKYSDCPYEFHYKQCRKLKRKKAKKVQELSHNEMWD